MKRSKINLGPSIKSGVGKHIYVMFAGRRQPSGSFELPAKAGGLERLLSLLLLIGAACAIGLLLWSQLFAA